MIEILACLLYTGDPELDPKFDLSACEKLQKSATTEEYELKADNYQIQYIVQPASGKRWGGRPNIAISGKCKMGSGGSNCDPHDTVAHIFFSKEKIQNENLGYNHGRLYLTLPLSSAPDIIEILRTDLPATGRCVLVNVEKSSDGDWTGTVTSQYGARCN